jgi:uncharacterized protein (DUF433 family)
VKRLTIREAIVEDPETLGGRPVFVGTRVLVHDVAAMAKSGVTFKEILETYPSVRDWQVELALTYARNFPA